MIATESWRFSPADPFWPLRIAAWVRRTAVRKIERNASVSTTVWIASCRPGRKLTACSLPLRASSSVRRRASTVRTADERRMSTVRLLNVVLS